MRNLNFPHAMDQDDFKFESTSSLSSLQLSVRWQDKLSFVSVSIKNAAGEVVSERKLEPTLVPLATQTPGFFYGTYDGVAYELLNAEETIHGDLLAAGSSLEFGGQFKGSSMMKHAKKVKFVQQKFDVEVCDVLPTEKIVWLQGDQASDPRIPVHVQVHKTLVFAPMDQQLQDQSSQEDPELFLQQTVDSWHILRDSVPKTRDPGPKPGSTFSGKPSLLPDDSAKKKDRDVQTFRHEMLHTKFVCGVKDASSQSAARVTNFLDGAERCGIHERNSDGLVNLILSGGAGGVAGRRWSDLILDSEERRFLGELNGVPSLRDVVDAWSNGEFGTFWTANMRGHFFQCRNEMRSQWGKEVATNLQHGLAGSMCRLAVLATVLKGLQLSHGTTGLEDGAKLRMDREISRMLEHVASPQKQDLSEHRAVEFSLYDALLPHLQAMGQGEAMFRKLVKDLTSESVPRVSKTTSDMS